MCQIENASKLLSENNRNDGPGLNGSKLVFIASLSLISITIVAIPAVGRPAVTVCVAGARPGSHLLPWCRPEGESSPADAADVQRPDRVGHGSHAAPDGTPRHVRRLLAAPRPGPDLASRREALRSESFPPLWEDSDQPRDGDGRSDGPGPALQPRLAGQEHREQQAEDVGVHRLRGAASRPHGPRSWQLRQTSLRQHRSHHLLLRPRAGGDLPLSLVTLLNTRLAARGREADPGQIPWEEGGAEGAVREGAAGRLLLSEILGGPQHCGLREWGSFLRGHFHVSLDWLYRESWFYLHLIICRYESTENMTIQCSTKVCSFGKQVVEKVETEYARFEGGRFVYKLHRSPMCEYMINFILKLKHLPETYMKNSVLENFTILQVGISGIVTWIQSPKFLNSNQTLN